MTKVYCADISCAFCNDNGVCTQKKIALSWSSTMTLHEGRKEFNRCKMYQKSEDAIRIEAVMEELLRRKEE